MIEFQILEYYWSIFTFINLCIFHSYSCSIHFSASKTDSGPALTVKRVKVDGPHKRGRFKTGWSRSEPEWHLDDENFTKVKDTINDSERPFEPN